MPTFFVDGFEQKEHTMTEIQNNARESDNPILNNPYEEPRFHYDAYTNGNLDYSKVLEGRRPYTSILSVTPSGQQSPEIFGASDFDDADPNAWFINHIREVVGKWRNSSYAGATRVTRELLNFWFNNPERAFRQRLFFCQREAVETAVYLNEIADRDPNIGRSILNELEGRRNTVSFDSDYVLPRTAFKMATGTGKTVVMAMFILYNYLNKKEYPTDTRFADHFLLVAPGITIRDRLGVLFIDDSSKWVNDKEDYYHVRQLIPSVYEHQLGGLNAAITITNYHQFEPKVYSGKKASPMDGKMVYKDGQMVKQTDKEEFSVVLSRVVGKNMKGKRILVINDEAHHCYLPKATTGKASNDDETREGTEENEKAMVWYEGLRQLKLQGYRIQHVYDLSATPYYLKGSGYKEYSIFPWVVSDFGLVDAIESGLVKIPFLPTFDDTQDLDEPKLRNIYEHIRGELPKKGVRGAKKAAKEESQRTGKETAPQGEQAQNLPTLLNSALAQFVKDYEDYDKGMRQEGEEGINVFSTPPVFIVVCNNTTVSKEVYKYIAGYESVDANGNKIYVEGHFPIFSNYQNNLPLKRQPTLLIDSTAIDEAGETISDEFKAVFREEIEQFKREYAQIHGSGSADNLTDGDILREVVNSVGKPGTLGAHIRCVVSVSMLTEGWDANTVTHVCGVRAFGSQLLCEQVAGRALRRRSYELVAYDIRTGKEIDPKDLHRYKKENVTYKFPPEYAHIIGVPFKTFKGGSATPPRPPKPQTIIKALPERIGYEIRFPNITGYRVELKYGKISVDYTGLPKFHLDLTQIPTRTIMMTAVTDQQIEMEIDYRDVRDAQVIYNLTQKLISIKYNDTKTGRMFQLLPQLKDIVEQWYETQIEILGGDGSPEQRRLILNWDINKVVANIYEGIRMAGSSSERISAILNYYNPEGSTTYVRGATTKSIYPTVKSHVNYVVADTDSWEQIAAKTLEELPEVQYYVKNHFLDFKIPYSDGSVEHDYMPDFIAVCKTKSGELVNLIIEISGFSNDRTGNKDIKRHYTHDYWLPAANNLEKYGRWDFIEIDDIMTIKATLIEKINTL